MRPNITILNGSLSGRDGNTGALLKLLVAELSPKAELRELVLSEAIDSDKLRSALAASHAFIFATGTYWDSWGSPLQKFLEDLTDTEGDPSIWLGKPAALLVTMHSVGGKEVLSRLQGVLSTLGCVIPPMSGMAYSLANHLALKFPGQGAAAADFWSPRDLAVIAHNLLESLKTGEKNWKSWPVDGEDFRQKWFSVDPPGGVQ